MDKKLVVFDMDKTLITGNTWEDFNLALGVTADQDWDLYSAFSKDEITYDQWLAELKKLYKLEENKHTKEQVLEHLTQYNVKEDAMQTVKEITDAGHDTLLLTGSFQMTANAVAFETGVADAVATTRCVFNEEGYLVDIISEGNERQAKVRQLSEFCEKRNIDLANCVVIGDGGNMLDLFGLLNKSVTFSDSSEQMKQAATHTIRSLSELPDLIKQL